MLLNKGGIIMQGYTGMVQPRSSDIQHIGVLGMRWGKRRASSATAKPTTSKGGTKQGNYDKVYDSQGLSSRKQKVLITENNLRAKVASNRKEAADRIKFYGGKNVATEAIASEATHTKRVRAGIGYTASLLSAGVGVMMLSTPLGIIPAAGGLTIAIATSVGNSYVTKHAKEQVAYTKDSSAGHDVVVRKSDN